MSFFPCGVFPPTVEAVDLPLPRKNGNKKKAHLEKRASSPVPQRLRRRGRRQLRARRRDETRGPDLGGDRRVRRGVDDGPRGPDPQRREQLNEARVHDPARVAEGMEGQARGGADGGPLREARGQVGQVLVEGALGGGERHGRGGVEGDKAGFPALAAPPGGVFVEVTRLGAKPADVVVEKFFREEEGKEVREKKRYASKPKKTGKKKGRRGKKKSRRHSFTCCLLASRR